MIKPASTIFLAMALVALLSITLHFQVQDLEGIHEVDVVVIKLSLSKRASGNALAEASANEKRLATVAAEPT
ncbi:hypothetical protein EJB05_36672, partial [Eragrostis curvula]